jgi:hypothetical protein
MRLILAAAFALIFMNVARAEEASSTLDQAAVRSARMLMRDDAIFFATHPSARTLYDWTTVGIQPPAEDISPEKIRQAFQSNEIAAERRFSKPVIVRGELNSVVRGRDNLIFVRFVGGGLGAEQRRAMSSYGIADTDPSKFLSDMSGGMYTGGAQASVSDQYADTVAKWEPGQKIAVRCEEASNVRLALLLEKCVPLDAVIANAEKIADRQSDLLLARQSLEVNGRADSDKKNEAKTQSMTKKELNDARLVAFYAGGLWLRECQHEDYGSWGKCAQNVQRRTKELPFALYERAQKDLGIRLPIRETSPAAKPASQQQADRK